MTTAHMPQTGAYAACRDVQGKFLRDPCPFVVSTQRSRQLPPSNRCCPSPPHVLRSSIPLKPGKLVHEKKLVRFHRCTTSTICQGERRNTREAYLVPVHLLAFVTLRDRGGVVLSFSNMGRSRDPEPRTWISASAHRTLVPRFRLTNIFQAALDDPYQSLRL